MMWRRSSESLISFQQDREFDELWEQGIAEHYPNPYLETPQTKLLVFL